jgi:N-acetylglutamate synthase-like GNAT family acetyltransferase
MDNNFIVDDLKIEEINLLSNMVNNVFDEFVGGDYSEMGNREFKDYITPQNILKRINDKISKFYVARYNKDVIGMLEIKNKEHISLFFVRKEYHQKGIGKTLFDNYLKSIKKSSIKSITVNSSFFAENIYSKMGFIKTDEIQERNGIKYIPMEYKI